MREPIVILGGGLAGLSAAARLDGEAILYERRASLGGLCRQVTAGGFRFDAVPHVLHFRDRATRELVADLLHGRLRSYARQARVASHGVWLRYPFQAHLFGLPAEVIEECVRGRRGANGCAGPGPRTFEDWVYATFGSGIARHFMVPYNTKFWTLPPSALTCEWLDGLVPVPSLEQTIRGAQGTDQTEYGYNVTFWYPTEGGLGALVGALLERARRLSLGKRLVRIDTAARRLRFADGEEVAYERLLSSIPLPELTTLLEPLRSDIAEALEALRWTSVAVVHLGVAGPPAVPWHWVYVPDPAVSFYRVGIPSHYAPDAAPAGSHILSAECSYSAWQPIDRSALIPRVVRELRALGLLASGARILEQRLVDLRYGYPIYDANYRPATALLRDYLASRGISLIGRFGSWRYLSVEQTLQDGLGAAQTVSDTAVSTAVSDTEAGDA